MQSTDHKVLFVEDDEFDRRAINRHLSKLGINVQVEFATNIKEARSILENCQPEIVFSDMHLPDGTGFDLLKEFPKSNFILLTGSSNENIEASAISKGAKKVILKDFDRTYLNKIENCLQELTSSKNAIDESGGNNLPMKEADGQAVMDLTHVTTTFDNNQELIQDLIEEFLNQTPSKLLNLKEAISNQDFPLIKDFAHGLKSSYSLLGVKEGYEILSRIETRSVEPGEKSIDAIHKDFARLDELTSKGFLQLKEYIAG